jgi:UDP-N-acetylmuramoyl-L-alanyl-D-glutamate--2,6-diaminopimelate ligase
MFRMIGSASQMPEALVMEVSSHALELRRVAGLSYDVGVFTNLTQDHLDFHKTMEAYFAAKRRLFERHMKSGAAAVVNVDDPWGRLLRDQLSGVRMMSYGKADDADVRIVSWNCTWDGIRMQLRTPQGPVELRSRLCGPFNLYNIAAFCAGALAMGVSVVEIQEALDDVRAVPGRLERLPLDRANFSVAVDYAHTPDALEKVLAAAREITSGRLLCVFGCGGDRDRTKRPRMADAVARGCDEAVVTSDNPRSESPDSIIDEIVGGMPLDFPFHVEVDRAAAIRKALAMAQPGDCVIIAGKGHETYQEIKGVRHPFDDKEVTQKQWLELCGAQR